MQSKPGKLGIQFYSMVEWTQCYLHSLFDIVSGNGTGISSLELYMLIFREVRVHLVAKDMEISFFYRCSQGYYAHR